MRAARFHKQVENSQSSHEATRAEAHVRTLVPLMSLALLRADWRTSSAGVRDTTTAFSGRIPRSRDDVMQAYRLPS